MAIAILNTEVKNMEENFTNFKNSFSYGKRNNLNFKFLSRLTDDEAADFIEELFFLIGSALNDANLEKIFKHLINGQKYAYSQQSKYTYQEGAFTPFKKKLSESKIALLTSSGHFIEGNDPAPFGISNMSQQEAVKRIKDFLKEEPTLSIIPKNAQVNSLRVRHGGYDISGAQVDYDSVFPLKSLIILEKMGVIGQVAESAYSFVGACSQELLKKITERVWVNLLKEENPDAVLLVPV